MATFFNSYQILSGAVFHRYRLESIALSALLIRRWMGAEDRLVLVTDSETLKVFVVLGLISLYDEVIIPEEIGGIDPKHFFALIKLRGLSAIEAPVYSVDWDCYILSQELFGRIRAAKACGLHYECTCGAAYKTPDMYSYCLPSGTFEKSPINCGVVGFASERDKRRYCDFVFEFMRRYSAAPLPNQEPLFVMMFAEQQLLGFLKKELGVEVMFGQGNNGLFQDRTCFHLWGMKTGFDSDKPQRERHCDWCRDTMSQHGIEVPKLLDSPAAQALP
jgi:hypothetical protein